jgi:hypothetical protein
VQTLRGLSFGNGAFQERCSRGGGQLVANWVEVFAPGILAARAEHTWRDTLLLDSTDFRFTDPKIGRLTVAFNVFAAYGYRAVGRGRPVRCQ